MNKKQDISPLMRELSAYMAAAIKRKLPKEVAERAKLHLVAFWDAVFSKMVATEEWKHELDASDAVNDYLNSEATTRFVSAQYQRLSELMSELGLAKQ